VLKLSLHHVCTTHIHSDQVTGDSCDLLAVIHKKAREVATSPPPPPYTPKKACINFDMWGRVLDVINHVTFQLDRFGVSDPKVVENRYLQWTEGALTSLQQCTH